MIWNVYIIHHGSPTDVIECRNRDEARKAARCYKNSIKTKKHSGTDIRLRVKLSAYLEARTRMYAALALAKQNLAKQKQMQFSFMTPAIEQAESAIATAERAMRSAAEKHKVDWRGKHWASYPVGRNAKATEGRRAA